MLTKVFISYAWESEEHREWVKALANRLLSDGIDAVLDQYDLEPGDRLPQFMEQSVRSSDYVLIVCTPTYKQKADERIGGVATRATSSVASCFRSATRGNSSRS